MKSTTKRLPAAERAAFANELHALLTKPLDLTGMAESILPVLIRQVQTPRSKGRTDADAFKPLLLRE